MKKNALLLAGVLLSGAMYGQVARKVVVEHFTNTKCSICASRNPGFYNNLNAQSDVLHLSIYPSSPYSDCLLNNHNKTENDARTNYYGVYGGTPRLVIQGQAVSAGANYNDGAIFTPHTGMSSPASIRIEQSKYNNDSIRVNVIVKTEAAHSLGSLRLFVALAEDTVFYQGPNGEPKHFNVFRKALTDVTGDVVNLPSTVGDSVVFSASSVGHNDWVFSRIYAFVILQDAATKEAIQAERSQSSSGVVTGVHICDALPEVKIFPNPVSEMLNVSCPSLKTGSQLLLYDMTGRRVFVRPFHGQEVLDVSALPQGQYFLQLTHGGQRLVKKIIKE